MGNFQIGCSIAFGGLAFLKDECAERIGEYFTYPRSRFEADLAGYRAILTEARAR
jgi:hypothetical protein